MRGWLAIDRNVGEEAAYRLRTTRNRYAFIALTGIDKTSHAQGQNAPIVGESWRTCPQSGMASVSVTSSGMSVRRT